MNHGCCRYGCERWIGCWEWRWSIRWNRCATSSSGNRQTQVCLSWFITWLEDNALVCRWWCWRDSCGWRKYFLWVLTKRTDFNSRIMRPVKMQVHGANVTCSHQSQRQRHHQKEPRQTSPTRQGGVSPTSFVGGRFFFLPVDFLLSGFNYFLFSTAVLPSVNQEIPHNIHRPAYRRHFIQHLSKENIIESVGADQKKKQNKTKAKRFRLFNLWALLLSRKRHGTCYQYTWIHRRSLSYVPHWSEEVIFP